MAERETGFHLLPETGYFRREGVDVIAFEDFYPAGHQSGVSVISHGRRLAANGDVRLEPAPGQWQPVSKQLSRETDAEAGRVRTVLRFPDEENHLRGFNPTAAPDCRFEYAVTVAAEGGSVVVTAEWLQPPSAAWDGQVYFNLELFPGILFGKSWIMDGEQGVFPRQCAGPVLRTPSVYRRGVLPGGPGAMPPETVLGPADAAYHPMRADEETAAPYAEGRRFTLCPEDPSLHLTVTSETGRMRLVDGRLNHNNGWFVLSEPLRTGRAGECLRWRLTPETIPGWRAPTVLQISQIGYLPGQPKVAVVQTDVRTRPGKVTLMRVDADGPVPVLAAEPEEWGRFLRYRCWRFDFTDVRETGLYQLRCGDAVSEVFRIAPDLMDRGVWQSVLEYFLPVQMCHMLVREKYRVWHGLCHQDDARMAPVNHLHFDGYAQGPSTLTRFAPGEHVPGLHAGGWHDAGDFDLRVESQSGEAYILSLAWEAFGVYWDSATVDQRRKVVEIHHPDGKNDVMEQIEHGALAVLGGWDALGRLYRGVIASDLRQYVLLGDAANMTDGVPGNADDRWVFTEDNPTRELTVAAHLAAVSRALRDYDAGLAGRALAAARELFRVTRREEKNPCRAALFQAAAELFLATGEDDYRAALYAEADWAFAHPELTGWLAARVLPALGDADFAERTLRSVRAWKEQTLDPLMAETPYGIPYRPHIWGASWDIQRAACRYFYLNRAFPDVFGPEPVHRALHFVLGCHPGESVSFASGVGARSATTAYGFNRADWSYIPGGVISGTAMIRPDFPELLDWPYLWQQTEYVLGGGSSRFLFLALAARELEREASAR